MEARRAERELFEIRAVGDEDIERTPNLVQVPWHRPAADDLVEAVERTLNRGCRDRIEGNRVAPREVARIRLVGEVEGVPTRMKVGFFAGREQQSDVKPAIAKVAGEREKDVVLVIDESDTHGSNLRFRRIFDVEASRDQIELLKNIEERAQGLKRLFSRKVLWGPQRVPQALGR
ncbi:hypothetical protein OUZ56_032470 [Daphnia magna]|uniref:Uncharacterized protein n=1 Tax=Daphnia magna TaxID=35525 RepID=A0ABR0B912_9CRUS|nr:hypothetical protein OUZ56_032470 [Daphnia magna]